MGMHTLRMLKLYYDPTYTEGLDPMVRFPRERYRMLHQRLKDEANISIQRSPKARRVLIEAAHSPKYVEQFLKGTLPLDAIRRIGLRPWTPAIVERTLRLVGGSLCALEDAFLKRTIAGNMAGGTHHAYYDCGSGYCIFNDLAICALTAARHPEIKKILILDLDVHQGDGTASILQGHPKIFTCSIHAESNFPFRKEQSDLDVHLADDTSDGDYLACLHRTLAKIEAHTYDLILYQAGVDPLNEDALGKLSLTREGLRQRNQRVFQIYEKYKTPIVIFMGGGYAQPIERSVEAFEDLFKDAAKAISNAPYDSVSLVRHID